MKNELFIKLKKGDNISLPMDQEREIEHGPDPHSMPWNQVATTTVAWFDRLSGSMTFLVEAGDVISVINKPINKKG